MDGGDASLTAPSPGPSVPELRREWLTGALSALVRTPSVTGVHSERAMLTRVADLLDGAGCELTEVEVAPERPSLAAVLAGSGDGPTLVLNGHMDTVAPDDPGAWTVDPFGGAVHDGAVWGRGSVDMKGGLVCQIACAHALAAVAERRGTLVLHFAMGEETGEPGTLALLQRGFTGDYGITTEPTGGAVAIAQRGCCTYRLRIRGRSTHAATPAAGRNPVWALPALLESLQRYHDELTTHRHPLLGPAMATPTTVHLGVQHNAVGDTLELVLDRRLLPGETRESARSEVERLVAAAVDPRDGLSWEVEPNGNHYFRPAEIAADSTLAGCVADHVQRLAGSRPALIGTPYGSDVRNLVNDAGIEAVTFGPGQIADCHCPDEHLAVDELHRAALVISAVARELLV